MDTRKPTPLTPEQEDLIVEAEFADLLDGYLNSNHRKKVEIIERAFRFAKKAHKGIRRRSGEPYILHPIAVAKIAMQQIGLGSTSICAALLHDVVEDTDYTIQDIERHFGAKIAQLVAGLTKISGGIFGDKASSQAENIRKLLLTMSEDIRVVLIKMADRLHNMRTLGSMLPNKQYKIAGETLYIYAPLAHRLGLFSIKTELEDLAFKYEHPAAYNDIQLKIKESESRRQAVYTDFSLPIISRLDSLGIKYDAKARVKSAYSIWRKMQTKHIPFEEVFDLYAMRIIFDCPDDPAREKELCWSIYSHITDIYDKVHPDRTRDWLSRPKANGYQALHFTVMGPDGNWIEVQIRSRRMDEIAEKGFAAHWKYKESPAGSSSPEVADAQLAQWLATIKEILEDPNPSAIDFLDTLKLNLYASEIAVFTPGGEMLTLPQGSSALDVAFNLHSQMGSQCIAAKVNHRLVPLSHRLESGDQVEILTSATQTPKPEWMDFLASAKARTSLRAALRRLQAPAIKQGKEMLQTFLDNAEVAPSNEVLTRMMAFFHIPTRDALYIAIADGSVNLSRYILRESPKTSPSLLKKIFRIGPKSRTSKSPASPGPTIITPDHINTKEVYPLQLDDSRRNFVYAPCCSPIPGDDVMGYINDAGQVEIHSLACPTAQILKSSYGSRILATQWQSVSSPSEATIDIEGIDRKGILNELTREISVTRGFDIRRLSIHTHAEVFHCRLTILVTDSADITELCNRVRKIKGVQKAARIELPGLSSHPDESSHTPLNASTSDSSIS